MRHGDLKIILRETPGPVEWEVIHLLASGYSDTMPDAASAAEHTRREILLKKLATEPIVDPPLLNAVAHNTDSEVVPIPLTKAQRENLIEIIYGLRDYDMQNDPDNLKYLPEHKCSALLKALL